MPGTALDYPLVRDYLRELDAALAAVPARQAGELREQITSHLWDELGSEPSDDVVAAVLRRLGPPHELAAEAGAGEAAAPRAAWRRRPVRTALTRLSRRTRLILAVTVIAVIAMTGYTMAVYTAGGLRADGQTRWWYPRDYNREVYTQADEATQSTVPIRPGQQQGFFVDVYNPSNWAQTVVGFAARAEECPYSPCGPLGVATKGGASDDGAFVLKHHYRLPEVIPSHQWRMVRVMWTNASSLPGAGVGIMDELVLTVRVGVLDRTETLPLPQAYAVSSPGPGT